jgi:hypothetical protein
MRFDFKSGTPLAEGAPNEETMEWAQQAETARLTTIRQQEGLYASANKRRTQTAADGPIFSRTRCKRHQPNTHLNPAGSRARQRALHRERNPAQVNQVANPPDTHTHARRRAVTIDATNRAAKRQRRNSHAPHSNSHHQFLHQTGHRHTGRAPPQPCLTKDESTHTREDQHTRPRAPANSPKQAHSAHL